MGSKFIIEKKDSETEEKREFLLSETFVTVGKDLAATLVLSDDQIAPEQFAVMREGEHTLLLNRADGTWLNGEALPLGAQRELQKGDEIKVGEYIIAFSRNGISANDNVHEISLAPENNIAANENADESDEQIHRSFADILNHLRKEEDQFYFQIESVEHGRQRVFVEAEQMILGWDLSGKVATFEENAIVSPRAKVRKDWSGVVIYPLENGAVEINETAFADPQRLKNGDRLKLISAESPTIENETIITFHEPTALVVLNSILPKELPPPVMIENFVEADSAENSADLATETAETLEVPEPAQKLISAKKTSHRIFYYFTLTEILIMIVGTLLAAGIIFLILEIS